MGHIQDDLPRIQAATQWFMLAVQTADTSGTHASRSVLGIEEWSPILKLVLDNHTNCLKANLMLQHFMVNLIVQAVKILEPTIESFMSGSSPRLRSLPKRQSCDVTSSIMSKFHLLAINASFTSKVHACTYLVLSKRWGVMRVWCTYDCFLSPIPLICYSLLSFRCLLFKSFIFTKNGDIVLWSNKGCIRPNQ